MKPYQRITLVVLLALLLGGAGNYWLGASPVAVQSLQPSVQAWSTGWRAENDLLGAAALWQAHAPWGVAPVAPVEEAPPPPPPPVPVGVSKDGRIYTAIFQVNGTGVVRLGAGGRLPEGGHVLQVTGRRVVWLDGDGRRQQREIFNDFQGGQ